MALNESLSLYLHIPFCQQRCSYCDFNTYTTVEELRPAYVQAMEREIRVVAGSQKRQAHTVFFGGGTPSLLMVAELDLIFSALSECFLITKDAEITLEANPESVDQDYLASLRKLGFNRLSFGVQSIHPAELNLLGRTHSFETVTEVLKQSRKAGFENINLDLIYGLPNQTLRQWADSLAAAIELRPEHLSLYCLTIEKGTPLHRQLKHGLIASPDPDVAADEYELAGEMTAAAGYSQYEISNWSLPGFQCQHNLTYWRNGQYLGFGAGAHGHAAGWRYEVVKQPRVYIRRLDGRSGNQYPWSQTVADHHRLSNQEAMTDTILTQLRLTDEGIDLDAFERIFGMRLPEAFPGISEELVEMGLLEQKARRLLLTQRGRLLSNQAFRRFL